MKRVFNLKFISSVMLIAGLAATLVPPAVAQSLSLSPGVPMAQSATLSGSWQLANMTAGGLPTPMVPPQDTPLTAEFSDGSLFGSGGCNRFKGGYQVEGNQLKIGPLASTMMACEQPVMQQEMLYLKALEGAQRYEISEQGLTIFYETDQGSGVLRFTSQSVRGLW